jgi:predicted metal-dependent enzyme (double-stranded beta helix superfamily)
VLSTALPRSRAPLGTDTVADIAVALLSARPIWHGVARFDPDIRQPVRLFADDAFEAWVIGWFSGQGLGFHDHGESAGAIVVAEGRLHERTLGGQHLETRRLERGIVRSLPPHTVHAVANVDARAATSIHVYSPPLASHFDPVSRQPVRTVTVGLEVPVLPSAVAQLLRIDHRV